MRRGLVRKKKKKHLELVYLSCDNHISDFKKKNREGV